MKKILSLILAITFVFALAACGTSKEGSNGDSKKLVVGASNVPHAEILEKAKPILAEKGIDLEIQTFQDYILPNKSLESKELDANYFQHIPYLEQQIKENGYDFVNVGAIHIEPMAVFSKKYKSLDELPKGATIIFSNSVSEQGRILSLLEKGGLIKLKDGINKVNATVKDIVGNPKNVKFKPDYEPSLLPQIYNNNEGDAVVINANFALDAGLNPVKDSIEIEGSESPYANIIVVRKEDEKKESIKTLVEVLQSKEIQDFISKEYKGAVLPVSK
ncbi:MetQ/NlpA family ABC transporter substrate-binding protein [Niallia sp. 03133]|uniref:MetQ/NlpA family ABC transporter substrate-binding protein n=1 Tax=Niallia sp. 03133 TaxID=3458060 RepID=UPI004043B6BC